MEALCRITLIAGIAIVLRWGARGVAAGYALASLATWYPQVAVALRLTGLGFGRGHSAVWPVPSG